MASLSIRGLDEETPARLKAAARARGVSVNRHALDLLRRGLGLLPRNGLLAGNRPDDFLP